MADVARASGLLIYRVEAGVTEYLLLQASYPPHHWTPPKGHVDPGEDEWTAAKREANEEAGIDVDKHLDIKPVTKVLNYRDERKKRDKRVTYYLAKLRDNAGYEVKLSHEHQAFTWAPFDEALKLSQYEDMINLIKEVHADAK
ncbi:bis(5'-nucleosyl)-tetraphosphatase [Aphelenchoides avenae]|nr:bis(5'-nucleosyl)-tetraphosphatase [Aphelenchus avenae]